MKNEQTIRDNCSASSCQRPPFWSTRPSAHSATFIICNESFRGLDGGREPVSHIVTFDLRCNEAIF